MSHRALIAPRRVTDHAVASIHFGPTLSASPIECVCGWSGSVADVKAHRHRPLRVYVASREADPAMPWLQMPDTRLFSSAVL